MIATYAPDFSEAVLNDLYRYPMKKLPVARALAVVGGIFGAHRFYLGRPLTGVCMLLTAGGVLIWWIRDLLRLKAQVAAYNQDQQHRKDNQQPPRALAFLPPRSEAAMPDRPLWAKKRQTRTTLIAGCVLLMIFGLSLGAISGAIELYEPVITLGVFVILTLLGARMSKLSRLPIIGGLNRWAHRLRLYYFHVDPGSTLMMAARPFIGVLIAPLRTQARAEVRLYLQLGTTFALIFLGFDLYEYAQYSSFWTGAGTTLAEFVQTLIYTYAFVAPIGAILTTQLLLQSRDRVIWIQCGLLTISVYWGLSLAGAI